MAHEVPWDKFVLETFIELAVLTKTEEEVMRTRVAGWTISEQAEKLGLSESTVSRIIKRLKCKYDRVQKYSPLLPPRKASEKETYMDTH